MEVAAEHPDARANNRGNHRALGGAGFAGGGGFRGRATGRDARGPCGGAARDEVIGSVVTVLAENDLPEAGRLVAGMRSGAAQDRATAAIFETWFKKGGSERAAAFEWLAAVPDEETRRAAFTRAAWNWPVSDPAEARDFIAGPLGDMVQDATVQWTARIQAGANPEATMAWAGALPAGRRESARRAALGAWVQARPEGAITFTRALPSGPERVVAIETMSQSLASQSPEQAVQWLRELPPAEQKSPAKFSTARILRMRSGGCWTTR